MSVLRVVWICHFSNSEIRKIIPLFAKDYYSVLKKKFGKGNDGFSDFAPWVSNLIIEFEKFNDVELHIIAPHKGLKKLIFRFERNGITYHFFKPDFLFLIEKTLDKVYRRRQKKFLLNRYLIKKILKRVKPEIINLIGTENPYYSISALDVKDIPMYVSAQTVYTNPNRQEMAGNVDQLKWDIELKIHKKEKYFGCTGRMHRDLILKNNPNAIIFKMFFPITKPFNQSVVPKEFDFVFFAAGITSQKGIEDALEALSLVVKEKPDVTLNVIGRCKSDYKRKLIEIIRRFGIINNVFFTDFFAVHEDMYQQVKKGRFALLPVKLDVISGTIIESILLGLPVVTYKTTGTPYLNKKGDAILLADIGDIQKLADNMILLMNKPTHTESLIRNARLLVEKEFDNEFSARRLVKNYEAVINNYYNKTPIPEELLFNINDFPVY